MVLGEGRHSRVLCESQEVLHLRSIPAEIIIKTKSVALSAGNGKKLWLTAGIHEPYSFSSIHLHYLFSVGATLGGKS